VHKVLADVNAVGLLLWWTCILSVNEQTCKMDKILLSPSTFDCYSQFCIEVCGGWCWLTCLFEANLSNAQRHVIFISVFLCSVILTWHGALALVILNSSISRMFSPRRFQYQIWIMLRDVEFWFPCTLTQLFWYTMVFM